MAHRLIAGSSDKCATPHGHNEIVTVHLQPVRLDVLCGQVNMVESFERAKSTWHSWIDNHVDHALQLSHTDPILDWFRMSEPQRLSRILITQGDPTTEMLSVCMMSKLNAFLAADGGRLQCVTIEIEETPTNTVRLTGPAADHFPPTERSWWTRADMSINDLHLAPASLREVVLA